MPPLLLDTGDISQRIAMVLDELGVQWTRTVAERPTEGPQSNSHDQKVVAYLVGDGPLEGTWEARGEDADLVLFDRMLKQLDDDWKYHLQAYGRIAAAMRRVGR